MKTFSFGRALLFMAILLSALLLTAPASDAKKLPSPTRVATKKCAKLYKGATARKQCVKRQVKLICHTAKYKKQKACKAYQKPAKKPGGTSTKPGTTDPTTTDPTTTDPANQTWVCDDGTDANVDTDGTIWCSDESTPTLSDGSNDPGTVTVLPCEDGSEPTVDASSGELTCADGSNPGTTALTCADGSLPDVDPDTGDTVCADGSEPS